MLLVLGWKVFAPLDNGWTHNYTCSALDLRKTSDRQAEVGLSGLMQDTHSTSMSTISDDIIGIINAELN